VSDVGTRLCVQYTADVVQTLLIFALQNIADVCEIVTNNEIHNFVNNNNNNNNNNKALIS